MSLIVNGREEALPQPPTLPALLAALRLEGRLAVERNGEIVPRSVWPTTALSDGDQLEIVRAIGGG